MSSTSKADLHIHSRFSDRAADWVLRRLEFPASYSDPEWIYDAQREAGMDFVTITDHNTIEGCLRIADRPGVFLSEEVIASFPGDGCRAHLLVWGITEARHREIQELRGNLYELAGYLREAGIAHAVAHPFHSPDEKLTARHLRELVVLFEHFELINGRYNELLGEAAREVFGRLTPERLAAFAAECGRDPVGAEPWRKKGVGGSDDHGGVFPARAYTETPACATPDEFLEHVRAGRCEARGLGGTPLTLAHSTYSTAFQYVRAKFSKNPADPGAVLLEKVFERFMEGKDPTEFTLAEKLGFLVQGVATGKIFELAKAGQNSLWKEMAGYFSQREVHEAIANATKGVKEPERRAFLMADMIANQLAFRFFTQFIKQITTGKLLESIQMISPLVPIVGLLAPYLHGFRMTPRRVLAEYSTGLCGEVVPQLDTHRRAWFTDTLDDVNGVATTIRKMTAAGVAAGHDLVVITSRSEVSIPDIPIKNFPPIGDFELPEYELQRLSFPPVLEILDYLSRERFSELIISTPGPIGLTAVLAAKLLGIPSVSIYHTDFPQYVRILTDDSFMETLTWNFMHWFYTQQELVYVNSEDYRKCWEQRGIPPERLKMLPRGLDTRLFHPVRRDGDFWKSRGMRDGETGVLFVGRISKEKNLDVLVEAAKTLLAESLPLRFLFVGDGPYSKQLKRLLPDAIFTGYLTGETLATAYASADLFAFPSTTDTFGNVILEAQAAGLPCVVSDQGGPRDLVDDGRDGFVAAALDAGELAEAIRKLASSPDLRAAMAAASRAKVEDRDWTRAFEAFWGESSLINPAGGAPPHVPA